MIFMIHLVHHVNLEILSNKLLGNARLIYFDSELWCRVHIIWHYLRAPRV
jgi:hypothetical protein